MINYAYFFVKSHQFYLFFSTISPLKKVLYKNKGVPVHREPIKLLFFQLVFY